jgi:hypothetical protein
MKRVLGVSIAALSVVLVAGCGGGGSTPAASSGGSTTPAGGSTTSTGTASDAPSLDGGGGTGCLVAGSPWTVDVADLERQFPQVMSQLHVTSVKIDGAQKFIVGPDLKASFTDASTTTIKVKMSQGLTLQLVQKHHGTATGQLTGSGNKLDPEHWTGGISGTNTVTINGRASQAPFSLPDTHFGKATMTYSCSGSQLKLQVKGSPFHYVFTSG